MKDSVNKPSESAIETPVLIIGAGPFGLSLAAYLRDLGLDCVVAGDAMRFWREHMPAGMLLRSGLDWHLDVAEEATLEAFVRECGLDEAVVLPLSRDRYLEYVAWFMRRKAADVTPLHVERLARDEGARFVATCDTGSVTAHAVVVATGFRDYAVVPEELTAMLPKGAFGHTCEVNDFEAFRGRRVVIVGGRQSAFESAVLLAEAGARSVDVVYRHATPEFEPSDWSWVEALMRRTDSDPGWYRALSEPERTELGTRFWGEGRLKLEPWLAPRLDRPEVRLWPNDRLASADSRRDGLTLSLEAGATLEADFVLLATGYRVEVAQVPFLAGSALLDAIATLDGYPVLDTAMQSSVEGLYFTSLAATRDFGAFFGFTVSARSSSKLIGDSLAQKRNDI